jgi:IS66 C-terminal element
LQRGAHERASLNDDEFPKFVQARVEDVEGIGYGRGDDTLLESAKLNGIDPRAWLADVLARLPGHPANRVDELLPWNWQKPQPISAAA